MSKSSELNKQSGRKSDKQREYALEILMDVFEKDTMSHLSIRRVLGNAKELSKTDRAFITRLSEGTIERKITIDYVIDSFSKTKVKKMKPLIREIMRMSVYQILFMDGVPDSAACNEAVKIAKKRGFSGLSGFINGVLRNISREKENIKYPEKSDKIKYLSVKYSVPEWMVSKLISDYGEEIAINCFDNLYQGRENNLTARVNTSKAKVTDVMELLKVQGIDVKQSELADNTLIISNYDNVEDIEAFKQGLIQVQDISSILAGQISGVKNGDFCIDMCSAPGGKTMHIADLNQQGKIIARDISSQKTDKILENVNRNKFKNIDVEIWDATKFCAENEGKADLVIADVPCSGLGIIAKKTDIKYRISESNMEELSVLSKKILANAVRYLKDGGTLIFSTCTMNKQENEMTRKWLIDEMGLKPISIEKDLSVNILKEDIFKMAKDGHLQLFITKEHDGFYFAKFVKTV